MQLIAQNLLSFLWSFQTGNLGVELDEKANGLHYMEILDQCFVLSELMSNGELQDARSKS